MDVKQLAEEMAYLARNAYPNMTAEEQASFDAIRDYLAVNVRMFAVEYVNVK